MLDQAFDAAERGRALPQLHVAAVATAAASPPFTRIDSMPPKPPASGAPPPRGRWRRQPRIEHRLDVLVLREVLGDALRRLRAARDAQEERAHAAQQQPGSNEPRVEPS
jgi:hypothetical protein